MHDCRYIHDLCLLRLKTRHFYVSPLGSIVKRLLLQTWEPNLETQPSLPEGLGYDLATSVSLVRLRYLPGVQYLSNKFYKGQ